MQPAHPPLGPLSAVDDVITPATPIILLGASGVWVPPPGTRRVLMIATGPGAAGANGLNSGGAGGTAIGFVDCAMVRQFAWTIDAVHGAKIAGLVGGPASGINPGGASGGMVNLKGGIGMVMPVTHDGIGDIEFTIPASSADIVGVAETGTYNVISGHITTNSFGPGLFGAPGTFNTFGSLGGTHGSWPGGASFWGGCDAAAPNPPSVYGVGGPVNATQHGLGGPGVIMIWGG